MGKKVTLPTISLDDSQRSVYADHDPNQIEMMAEAVIAVDEKDNVIGPMSKHESHFGPGAYHRAFSVLLFNSQGKLLLQKRSSSKVTFPGVWANSCCSHPLHHASELEEQHSNGVKIAAIRKMDQELGIDPDSFSLEDFHYITKMRYSCRMNQDWIEREIDHILYIQSDVDLNPNPNEVEEIRWVSTEELEDMLIADEGDIIAPWFRCIAARIMNDKWWRCASSNETPHDLSDHLIHDMGDVSHMLPNSEGADLITSIIEIKPLVEQRINRVYVHVSMNG